MGIISGLVGLALVWWGRFSLFEKGCTALVGLMFVSMVGAALLTLPNLPNMMTGLVPTIPSGGGIVYVLSLAGGVGGTITLAAYGYWLREKGWTQPKFMRVLLSLGGVLADRYPEWSGKVFLVGFWAAAMSALFGVWNGVSPMFADFMGHSRGHDAEHPDSRIGGK